MNIYEIKHFEPKSHPRMSMDKRACQFAPFSALNGFYEKILEKEKEKKSKMLLSSDMLDNLNNKTNNINKDKLIEITYYKYDNYITEKGYIKKIDNIEKKIILRNKLEVYFKDIIDIKYQTNA